MNRKIKATMKEAGNILKKGFSELQKYDEKERFHLRSEYDTKIDIFLKSFIETEFPNDSIYSEESELIDKDSDTRWIIDPIDGTSYFIFGEPFFSISLAKEKNNEILEAHVFNPISNEYYYSDIIVKKSFLNDEIISVSNIEKIEDALLAFGFSANPEKIIQYLDNWKVEMENCKKALPWIGPALSICNVARGRIDGFIDYGCSFEGQAAASLILKNAGGKFLNSDKAEYNYKMKGGIFTNRKLTF